METTAHPKCRSASNVLLFGSLCVLVLAIPFFPIAGILWLVAVTLAVAGLMVRLLGVMQMSLAAWTTMILMVSAAIVGCLSAADGCGMQFLWVGAVLPALIVWILATYACWLSVDRALGSDNIGGKCATFTICWLGPPAIAGTIVTTIATAVCLIACLFSHCPGETLMMAVIWGFCSTPCWWIAMAFRDLVRSARTANRAQLKATHGEPAVPSYES